MTKKINIIIVLLFVFIQSAMTQTAPGKYWLRFTDKNNNGFSIDSPEEFLSPRAISRRTMQGISIVDNDMPVTQAYVDSIKSLGATILNVSKWFNAVTIETEDVDLLNTITSLPFILSLEKTIRIKDNKSWPELIGSAVEIESEKGISTTYDYGPAAHQIEMVNGHVLHDLGFTGEGLQIAIIDAGFTFADVHPAFDNLRTEGRILGTRDFVDFDDSVYSHHPHGMNVLSTMAADIPGIMVGTAPKASYWLLRSEDTGSEYRIEEDNWIAAAEFADSAGVDIINTSLGYNTFTDANQNYSYANLDGNTARITIGCDIAASKGIMVVVSAGNEGANSWHFIDVPADADSVLTVGAISADSSYASLSSVGPTADGRVKPDIAVMGKAVYIATGDSYYTTGSGTSFSAPITAGLVACLWQAHPSITNMQLIEVIKQSANQYLNPDTLKGYGIPDFGHAHSILNTLEYQPLTNREIIYVYPNPFTDNIIIEFYTTDSQDVKLEIFDLMGRRIFEKSAEVIPEHYNRLDINGLEDLILTAYIMRVTTQNKVYLNKLIKTNY